MFVPEGLRRRYPEVTEDWEWLYPATEFYDLSRKEVFIGWYRLIGVGKYVDLIDHIDVSFLVGEANLSKEADADFFGGGKNLSQMMHWATGVKYAHLPRNALRELFIGYEFWHLEGWEVFGEDAINDLIAEEQGRMLGRRLAAADIKSGAELVRKIDSDFREARAWVGAMLRLRRDEFDALILAEEPSKARYWWRRGPFVPPWGRRGDAKSIKQLLEEGQTVGEVYKSRLVEHLIPIYTLIYEVDEWERRNGRVGLTSLMVKIVEGKYDDQFRRAKKRFGTEWEWNP